MRRQAFVLRALVLAVAAIAAAKPAFADATVTILNGNAPGVGFNDPTPAVPVGGNPGTTVGQQRLIAFQRAAALWGARLDSAVEIRVLATFEPLACTATGAVLGSAGTIFIFRDFPGAVLPGTWHHSALADKRAGFELNPDPFLGVTPAPDLRARFNSSIGLPTCLAASSWYYGLDANEAPNQIDLVAVVLHELGHGVGFSGFANVSTGAQPQDLSDVYAVNLLDTSTFKTWDQMSNAERQASAINSRRLVWEGDQVHADAPSVLSLGTPILSVTAPASIAGIYAVGTASFGPPLTVAALSGQVVQALDAAEPAVPPLPAGTTTDGCSTFSNAAAVAGRLALVDRGLCGFTVKVKNAQLAGAIGVIVVDNVAGGPPAGLGGADPTITISSVRITLADGNLIKAQLGSGVAAVLGVDPTLLAGADPQGRVYMNAPNPVQPGSSVSHWDPLAMPNQLMEPAINPDLTHSLVPPQDLTVSLLRDIGWYPDADVDVFADDVDACVGPASDAVRGDGGHGHHERPVHQRMYDERLHPRRGGGGPQPWFVHPRRGLPWRYVARCGADHRR
jgi:PA domain